MWRSFDPDILLAPLGCLADYQNKRLPSHGSCWISMAVLSQTAPGVQLHQGCDLAWSLPVAPMIFLHVPRSVSLLKRFRGFALSLLCRMVTLACDELKTLRFQSSVSWGLW